MMYTLIYYDDGCDHSVATLCKYRISSIKRPGVYLLPEFADPALIQDRRLYGTGVYKHNDVILRASTPKWRAAASFVDFSADSTALSLKLTS